MAKVKLGEVAREYKKTVTVKSADAKIVGLEHLIPQEVTLSNWDENTNNTFTKAFKKEQVLFGRRRAYLKKAAYAPFDGICSGDITVIEAIEGKIEKLLLPFIIQSDKFFEFAVGKSAGSLSPRVKWEHLKNYEFELPSLDEQKKLAKTLWVAERLKQKYIKAIFTAQQLLDKYIIDNCWDIKKYKVFPLVKIVNNTTINFIDGDWIESKDQSPDGIRLLQLADIGTGEFLDNSQKFISDETFKRLKCYEVVSGDILISRMADPIGRSCIIPNAGYKMITAVDCCIVRVDNITNFAEYWNFVFNSSIWYSKVLSFASGTTRIRISRKSLEQILVPIPVADDQTKMLRAMRRIKVLINELNEKINQIKLIQFRLANMEVK